MNIYYVLLIFIISSSCANKQHVLHDQLSKNDSYQHQYQGHYKTGKPYIINSVRYVPYTKVHNKYTQIGQASWYGKQDHNKITANGDKFNKYMLSAAHQTLPIPSIIKVTNLQNDKQLILQVSDRGPYAKNRILDVSEAAAERLGFKHLGTTNVKIEYMHEETDNFLTRLNLSKKHGSRTKIKAELAPKCSIKCYIELINAKHNLLELTVEQQRLYQQSIEQNKI